MTKEQLAEKLNGRQYREEISDGEELDARAAGLVVVFGYSDDNVEIAGAFHDERGAWGGTEVLIDAKGMLPLRDDIDDDETLEDFFIRRKTARKIEVLWCKEPGYSWTLKTDIPHATFEVLEGDEKYCRGIVFALADLK